MSLNSIVGEDGIVEKAQKAADETERAGVKEELELKIANLQMEKNKIGSELTKEDIVGILNELEGIDIDTVGGIIEGEYKGFGYIVDEDNRVIVSEKVKGEKPEGIAAILTSGEGAEEVEIQVMANLNGGTITSIEAVNGAELKEDKSNTEKIYVVRDNGEYAFRIRGSNGRTIKVSCTVNNAIPPREDILTGVKMITSSGIKRIKVMGKTEEEGAEEEQEIYSFDVIRYEGDMILDGTTEYEGATLTSNIYEFGSENDVGTSRRRSKEYSSIKSRRRYRNKRRSNTNISKKQWRISEDQKV